MKYILLMMLMTDSDISVVCNDFSSTVDAHRSMRVLQDNGFNKNDAYELTDFIYMYAKRDGYLNENCIDHLLNNREHYKREHKLSEGKK